ncbi:hypothetical protein [Streptomyces sp. NPDC002559]
MLITGPLSNGAVAEAIARCLGIPVRDVDMADEHTDQALRNWDAPVLCEKATVRGDLEVLLDVYTRDGVGPYSDEAGLAVDFARAARTVVLYSAEEALPSAYWLAADDGTVTRARLFVSDDEEPTYTIDAVEAPVARLPHTPVTRLPEIVREQRTATPVSDRFTGLLQALDSNRAEEPGTPHWMARTRLATWEQLVRTMTDRWPRPTGTPQISTWSASKHETNWKRSGDSSPPESSNCWSRPWSRWTHGFSNSRSRTTTGSTDYSPDRRGRAVRRPGPAAGGGTGAPTHSPGEHPPADLKTGPVRVRPGGRDVGVVGCGGFGGGVSGVTVGSSGFVSSG